MGVAGSAGVAGDGAYGNPAGSHVHSLNSFRYKPVSELNFVSLSESCMLPVKAASSSQRTASGIRIFSRIVVPEMVRVPRGTDLSGVLDW